MKEMQGKSDIESGGSLSPINETGARLIALRQARGLSQKEVAQKIGVNYTSYSAWEIGEYRKNGGQTRQPVELKGKHIAALADLYGVSADYIIGRSSYKAIDGAALADITGLSDTALRVLQSCAHDPRLSVCAVVSALLDEYNHAHTDGRDGGVIVWLGSYATLAPDIDIADADAGIAAYPFTPREQDINALARTYHNVKLAVNQFRQYYGPALSPETDADGETVSN